MSLGRTTTSAIAAALVALAACSKSREVESAGAGRPDPCARCHGGTDNVTGAPPNGLAGEQATTELAVGAHTRHVRAGSAAAFPCTACHPDPRIAGGHHLNGVRDVVFGGVATTGLADAPAWNRAEATCSGTYCHGALLGGGTNTAPRWTGGAGEATCGACHGVPPPEPHPEAPGGLAACNGCHGSTVDVTGAIIPAAAGGTHVDGRLQLAGVHDGAWIDPASASFHAFAANDGLAACQRCHGADLSGGLSGVACAQCHAAGGVAPQLSTCTGCHGGTDGASGAPPRERWGARPDPLRTGAHTAHVTGSDLAPPFGCDACHATPATMFTVGHIDPSPAEVVFGGLATTGTNPAPWDRGAATCGTVYCHGGPLDAGGANTAPLWTGGPGEATCGACHALPPPPPHPEVARDLTTCNLCHPQTVNAAGAVIPPASGGLHLDGVVETAGGHDAAWMEPANPGFHAVAANQGLSGCQPCHGPQLDGVGGMTTVACSACHSGAVAPVLGCTGCHGGTDNATGAPPRPQWAFRGDAAEAALRTGAHTAHVSSSPIAPPFGCDVCHVTPSDWLAPGHVGPQATAEVVFSGLAAASLPQAPTWDRTSPTCAVYCHGATLHGGSVGAPTWTAVGQGQAGCGTCHGIPPTSPPHPAVASDLVGCHDCHPTTIDAAGALVPPAGGGKHLNGLIDGGHVGEWMNPSSLEFHAYAANRNLSNCRICHGPALDGVGGSTSVGCADCHDGASAPAWGCTTCHGGVENATGAPPKATWGNRADAVRVGAHSSHVGTNPISAPIACGECHVMPADPFAAGHVDPARAEVVLQGPVSGLSGGTWNYPVTGAPTCSSTYCHGNFPRGATTNAPDWTGTGQAACGSCHAARPIAYLHNRHQREYATGTIPWWPLPGGSTWVTCDQCHIGIASSVNSTTPPALALESGSGPPLHVNGTTDVVFKAGGTYAKGPSQGTCSSMACHPGETKTWPR